MGYYSFYKIIKDVIRTLFGSRIFKYFIIVTIIFILLFVFENKASATFSVNGYIRNTTTPVTYLMSDLPSDYQYYTVFRNGGSTFWVYYSDKPMVLRQVPNTNNRNTNYGFLEVANFTYKIINSSLDNNSYDLSYGNFLGPYVANSATVIDNVNYYIIQTQSVSSGNTYETSGYMPVASNYDVLDFEGNTIFNNSNAPSFTYPYFTPSETDIQNLNFENLFVELGDYDLDENSLYLHALQIVNSVPENNDVLYYYSDNVFILDKKSDYYHQLLDTTNFYFAIPKETINFGVDKSYLLVLTNKKSLEMNSVGLYEKDEENGFFDVVLIDTSGIVTNSEVINNNLNNLNNNINNINNNLNPNSSINQNVTTENQEEIDSNLNFNNHNQQLESINSNFLSRLLNLVTSISDYDTSVAYFDIPMPHSDKYLRLRSDVISAHLSQGMKNLISAMWFYMFTFYMYSYINKIYIALSTGKIIETFTSKGEVITNDML